MLPYLSTWTAVLLAVGDMDLSRRLRDCLIRAEVYSEEGGLAGLEDVTGEGGGTLGSLEGVGLR